MNKPTPRQWLRGGIVAAAALAVTLTALWLSRPGLQSLPQELPGVMGTDAALLVVYEGDQSAAQQALQAADRELRQVEALMSSRIEFSDIGRLNASPVGKAVKVSPATLEVLRIARDFTPASDGAFDVTVRPLLEMWKQAGQAQRLPTQQELSAARELVGWRHFELGDGTVTKLTDGATVDLGGIAKKYGIDRATEAMAATGVAGGMVNVGGDIRVFGPAPPRPGMADDGKGRKWTIGIRDPFGGPMLAQVELASGSVCSSGNYERFVMIDGKRRSHIVDPRTAMPADMVPAVTVVGPTAMEAGLWATALSVLGPDGLDAMKRHNPALEALVITGDEHDWQAHATAGMRAMMLRVEPGLGDRLQPTADSQPTPTTSQTESAITR